MLSFILLVLASVSTLVTSQYTATIDPNSVPQSTRDAWCRDQQSTCPLLCLQVPGSTGAIVNECSSQSLSYQCICSNNISPNASEYSQTIPYYVCTEANNQCVNNCPSSDSSCQSACRQDHPCGAQNPTRVKVTSTTARPATTTSATTTPTQSNLLGANPATGTAPRVTRMDMGHVYGLCAVVGGFVAGFAVLL